MSGHGGDAEGPRLLDQPRRQRFNREPRFTPVIPPELEREYQHYLRTQAHAFLRLVPPDRVRPLYGAARDWAKEHGHYDHRSPMTALLAFVQDRLPLPPLAVWAEDQARHPVAHLIESRHAGGEAIDSREPLAVRLLETEAGEWRVGLHVFADPPSWRGYMSFRAVSGGRRSGGKKTPGRRSLYRTADVFAETNPHLIHAIFKGYEPSTLEAFLRSVLP